MVMLLDLILCGEWQAVTEENKAVLQGRGCVAVGRARTMDIVELRNYGNSQWEMGIWVDINPAFP